MELENQAAKQAYIQLMSDALARKIQVLEQLQNLTEQQEKVIAAEPFDEALFLQTISIKEEQIQVLAQLDSGFEKLYDSVKEELTTSKSKYTAAITEMQAQIKKITDLSVILQALEKRNKSKMETMLVFKRKNIKSARVN
ncbi:MAG: hypothetical protein WBI07_15915, partial [Mobilitalea sp.]